MNFVAFALRAIPDTESERKRDQRLAGLCDDDVAKIMFHRHRQNGGVNGGLPVHQMRIAAIAWLAVRDESIRAGTSTEAGEVAAIEKLLHVCEGSGLHELVSWSGEGFDFPLLRLRALRHELAAASLFRPPLVGLQQALMVGPVPLGGFLDLPPSTDDDLCPHRRCQQEARNTALIYLRLKRARGELERDLYQSLTATLAAITIQESPIG